jgi:predicted TIM-barrel fold metal-dependent hydrolase
MPSRNLDFPVFDADNHLYETPDALTKFLAPEYKGVIDYVQVNGRTKIAVKGQISDYIPNPTFEVVGAPGAWEKYYREGNPEGKSIREMMGEPLRTPPAFFDPEPRVKLLDELGIDRTLVWPTLASLIEERLRDDPYATQAVVKALNRWMHEHWSFNYEDRIYTTPVINLSLLEPAIEELEWVVEHGAKIILIRPAPVHTLIASRSMALPEFDPFWERVAAHDIVVGLHSSDSGYQRYVNEWEGIPGGELRPFVDQTGFAALTTINKRPIEDCVTAIVGHGLPTRFPTLKFLPVENGSKWVLPLIKNFEHGYEQSPQYFDERPADVFLRNFWIHPFWEDDSVSLVKALGPDKIVFGSDYPHPEGLADPLDYVDDLAGLAEDDIAKIMGGNLARLIKVDVKV